MTKSKQTGNGQGSGVIAKIKKAPKKPVIPASKVKSLKRNFTKKLKTQIAKEQSGTLTGFSVKETKALNLLATKGTQGSEILLDLSHKLSLNSAETIKNHVVSNPTYGKQFIDDIDGVFGLKQLTSKRDLDTKDKMLDSLNKNQGRNGPMSPTSTKNVTNGFNFITNQFDPNLRYRPSSENRSLGDSPHPNVTNGSLSPKSRVIFKVPQTFSSDYKGSMTKDEERNLRMYSMYDNNNVKKQIQSTSDTPNIRKITK